MRHVESAIVIDFRPVVLEGHILLLSFMVVSMSGLQWVARTRMPCTAVKRMSCSILKPPDPH